VRIVPHTALPLFARKLAKLPNFENIVIVFPDTGAEKRFEHLVEKYLPQKLDSLVVYYKRKKGKERYMRLVWGDPRGKDVWIVDDLANTAGTQIACKDKLLEDGALSVSTFFPHSVCPTNESWRKFIDAGFAHVWMTDSCPITAQAVEGMEPFRVLSLVTELAQVIFSSCK